MSHPNCKRSAALLQAFLTQEAAEAAQLSRFEQRASKLDGMTFAQTLILGWLQHPEASVEQLAQVAQHLQVDIGRQGIDARFTPAAVVFLAALFTRSLALFRQQCRLPLACLTPFSAVYLLDSTQVALPASLAEGFAGNHLQQASLKTHLSFEYLTGTLAAVDWVAGRDPDQNCRLQQTLASPGSLHLFDLGYFSQQTLEAIAAQQAFFLCRLQSQTALYTLQGERLDLAALVQTLPPRAQEVAVLLGQRTHLPVRLCLQPVAPALAQQRRRKAKQKARKQKKTCSAAYLTLLGYDLFVTNVPYADLDTDAVFLLYHLRWQVELCFKAWKSQFRLAQLGNWRPERILVQLYARLIGIVLFHWVFAPARAQSERELSLTKAVWVFQATLPQLITHVAHRCPELSSLLFQLQQDFLRFACKDRRKKSPSTFARLMTLKP